MNRFRAARPVVAAGILLTAGAPALSACTVPHMTLAYASELVTCGGKTELKASGSTAQAHAMVEFADVYRSACVDRTVDYSANGSGAGIADFLAGETDFAASDSPLNAEQRARAKQRCGGSDAWHLPIVFGPMAITYNLPDVDSLVLDAPTIAKIFSGNISRWDDPDLVALNGPLPDQEIRVVYRSDLSGSTENFQAYLHAASGGVWDKEADKTFNGGVGVGAKGNEGTAALVRTTEGAISYNELAFAMDQGLFAAEIKTPASRKSKRPVRIGTDSVGKTIAGAKITGTGNDLVVDISSFYNPTEGDVYPIVLAGYEIVCSKYPDPVVGQAVKGFLQAAAGLGQASLNKQGYIPLPPDFQSRVWTAIEAIA
ncbi:phosphate ABC transporter substrate-binding protein PstS [Mycolicibacter minnesotensis]|uniref:Phosphate-binding protein n=1 Tax=Mycolicibacter minnesotensis TaxID=1118379 RepID=A0AA91RLK5_9MYCO|nr:phosphate ABC transporter substrate-binding protein PstS [Mycolicibacter minnesotensis]ORA99782.1 phosphate ABC transporter substrate-binding protein PstS [Mycolicibacter minnesotensis]